MFLAGVSAAASSNWIAQAAPFGQNPANIRNVVQTRDLLKKILMENILPFWFPQTLDKEKGGYRLNHDIEGRFKGPANKSLVVQARCVWFFAHLVREGYGSREHLDAARFGFEFLRDRMWDKQFGGFYWEVDASGETAVLPDKHLYGQSFGLYALAEYYLASGDEEALLLARKLFGVLEYIAYDTKYGGYIESFRRDWSVPPDTGQSYMGAPHDLKLMNTHLHLMEAFTTYYFASQDPTARQRLIELICIQSNTVLRKKLGACTDRYFRNWTPVRDAAFERVSYGHDLENIWLLMDACDAAGVPAAPLRDFFATLFDYSYQYGYDRDQGGFYYTGAFNSPADQRIKDWWVQAEALVSSLRMAKLTGEELYYEVFHRTLDWVNRRQVDWTHGDWFADITETGSPVGDKANAWKGPYHNGRAMMVCLKLLKEFS